MCELREAGNQKMYQSIQVLRKREQILDRLSSFFQNSRSQVLVCGNAHLLAITTDMEEIQAPKRTARARGVKLRYITEITKENLHYCKKQLGMVDELRHLEGIKGNFAISDSEFIASPDVCKENPVTDSVYSDVASILKQQWYVFETLWNHAVPAEVRIRELQEGIDTKEQFDAAAKSEEEKRIDRIYFCLDCRTSFIFPDEGREHKGMTGHNRFKEFPVV
jgi:two-component system, OmpR family, sensor histidine kinase VicK